MNRKEISQLFGITEQQLDHRADEYERGEWTGSVGPIRAAERTAAMSKQHVDWDKIEQEYVDHGVEQIGEPITPTRRLEISDIENIFTGRPPII